LLFIIYYN